MVLQKLLFDIEQCVRIWTPYEKTMREKFMRNTCAVYISLAMIYITGALIFVLTPVITGRSLPLNVVYPFPISEFWIYCVAYGMNLFSVSQCSITIVVDMVVIAVLWQAVFKFKLLGIQMRSVVTADKLRACIITYQNIFNYVREIDYTINYILLKLTISTSAYVISSGLLILNNAPLVEISVFLMITSISIWRLFVCCWSVQAVTDMSYNISWQIYDSPWTNASPNVRQTILMIVQRCQKPIAVSGSKFIPEISIKFCGKVLSTTFSYFMALRTILR
ncbi:odorant receptor Or2-like [Temnothorax longispinosus]|uniref:odorant receptor Or2-like n=1 Tax=Temnothorax longispinosus TaxID=300112 RepID=UPI003A997D61